MRFSQQEKFEIIRMVEDSELGVVRTLRELGINKSTFYKWYGNYLRKGFDGLAPKKRNSYWNRIPPRMREKVVGLGIGQSRVVATGAGLPYHGQTQVLHLREQCLSDT